MAAIAIALAVLVVGTAVWGSGLLMRPPWMAKTRQLGPDPKSAFGIEYEDVQFAAAGGAMLRGWFVAGKSKSAGVVTVHGAGANRSEFMPEMKMLHDAGYPVLMFDCEGQGMSDGRRIITLGARERRDVEAGVSWMKHERGIQRAAVFGCSQGAASSIEAAADDPQIDGVIAEASFLEPVEVLDFDVSHVRPDLSPWFVHFMDQIAVWRMGASATPGPIDIVGRIAPRPVLLMQGGADRMVPPHDVQALYDRAGEPRQLWIGAGAHHCGLRALYPDEYRDRVMNFLRKYFPLDSP